MAGAPDPRALRRELQLASIADIQGSIHANDQKSSAGLVVHGLLFAGVLTVVANIGAIIDDATPLAQWAGGALLVAAFVCFVLSIIALARATSPYEPTEVEETFGDDYEHVFFPLPTDLEKAIGPGVGTQHKALLVELEKVGSAEEIERVYAAEQVKLADIRDTQATRAKWGFGILQLELLAVAVFLALVGLVALDAPVVADDRPDQVGLRWTVTQHGKRQSVEDGGRLVVSRPNRPIDITLAARGEDDVRTAAVLGAATLRCRRGPDESVALGVSRRGEDEGLTVRVTLDPRKRCATGAKAIDIELAGHGESEDGSVADGKLVVDGG